ncbi:MAG: hypothetical protein IKD17_08335 [Alistipes sp.]|nr:hypothetical protein [Alistipes sp.]
MAALRVLIACARLVERGRLVEVVADYTRARLARGRSVVARRVFVTRGRATQRVEAARLAIVARFVAVRSSIGARVDKARGLAFEWKFAARLFVLRKYRNARAFVAGRVAAVRSFGLELAAAVRGSFARLGRAFVGAFDYSTARAVQLANIASFGLIVAARRASALADYIEKI